MSKDEILPKKYRPCVGIALFNTQGQVLVGERIDTPGAWQMPQGGVDESEDIQSAAFRELREEIGTNKAEIIKIACEKIRYEFPPDVAERLWKQWKNKYIGQEQTWIAMRFTGEDSDIKLNNHEPPEFSDYQWVNLNETLNLIVPFKRDVYKKIIALFSSITI